MRTRTSYRLLLFSLSCFALPLHAQAQTFSLEVTFDGLIAFVEQTVDGNQAVWALLIDANYDPGTPTSNDVPPCAFREEDPTELSHPYPPHLAAIRFKNAEVILDGTKITGIVPAIFVEGMDIRIDTGKKNPGTILLDPLVSREELSDALGEAKELYRQHDETKRAYTEDFASAMGAGSLAARVLIDFGDRVEAKPLVCSSAIRKYDFVSRTPPCPGSAELELGESVIVKQSSLSGPVIISLNGAPRLKVTALRDPVKIEIVNIVPAAIADPYYNPCFDFKHNHPKAFRWYYRLLNNPPTPATCRDHFIPCPTSGDFGGTKCPQMEMVLP